MNFRPDGYYDFDDDDEEGSENESGFSEESVDAVDAAPPPAVRLQLAMQRGALDEVAKLLADLPAYESLVLENGLKPLTYAASLGNAPLLELLLRQDADRGVAPDAYASYTPLMAVCSGFADDREEEHAARLECVKLLLAAGHEAGFRDRYGETALMRACKSAPIAAVETLLQVGGAQLNETDNDGWSPLFYAAFRGHQQLVEYLLAAGAEPAKPDKRNRYAYMIAMEKGFSELTDLLTPEQESSSDDFASSATKRSSIFDEEDGRYHQEVLDMVASASATTKRNAAIFDRRRVSLRDFLLLRAEHELQTLGILFSGHRKKILARVKQFHLGCWLPESLGVGERGECGRLMAVLEFVATLHRQLYVLRASYEYVRADLTKLSAKEAATAALALRASRGDLVRLNERLADLRRRLLAVNAESRACLAAEEIVD